MMNEEKEFLNEGGINGLNTFQAPTKRDNQIMTAFIAAHKTGANAEEMNALRSQFTAQFMQEYLADPKPKKIKTCASFLTDLLRGMSLKNKQLAQYIGMKEPNLSALLKGRRKISLDIAMKLGKIFNIAPELWLNVQTKNDILRLEQKNQTKYDHYSLLDLMQQTQKITA